MAKKSNSGSQPDSHAHSVDFPEIERILAFMQKHELEEFEYEREGFRIRLKKPSSHAAPLHALQPPEIVIASGAPHASRSAPPAQAAP
ncbi:MAG: hypothetical protein WA193_03295, partial [Candidatus Acidiferrales bacterium]